MLIWIYLTYDIYLLLIYSWRPSSVRAVRSLQYPPTFRYLTSLETLDYSANLFTVMPLEICGCIRLINLNFCGNQITLLPRDINKLTSLVDLNLSRLVLVMIIDVIVFSGCKKNFIQYLLIALYGV